VNCVDKTPRQGLGSGSRFTSKQKIEFIMRRSLFNSFLSLFALSPRNRKNSWNRSLDVGLILEVLERRDAPAILLVTTNANDGAGSLRQAVADANSGDTIQFDFLNNPNPYIELETQIQTDKNLTIDGQSYANTVTITAATGFSTRFFLFHNANNAVNETIQFITFLGGDARQYGNDDVGFKSGGAIFVQGGLTLSDCKFQANSGEEGGAVRVASLTSQDTLSVTWTRFINNTAPNGGAIYCSPAFAGSAGNIIVFASTFNNNYATTGSGGAIFANLSQGGNATFTVTDSSFYQNSAVVFGGAIDTNYNFTVLKTSVVGSGFRENHCDGMGGAIYWQGDLIVPNAATTRTLSLFDTTFTSNFAQNGGAVYVASVAHLGTVTEIIAGCLFDSNSAKGGTGPLNNRGGALFVSNHTEQTGEADSTVLNSTFVGNHATQDGGGIYFTQVTNGGENTANLCSLTVTKNFAGNEGGGVWAHICDTVTVWNSIIAGNLVLGDVLGFGGSSDLSGLFISLGYNLVGVSNGNSTSNWNQLTDITQANGAPPVNPGLDPNGLQDHGGYTRTIAVLATSVAYRTGDVSLWGIITDQRGFDRRGLDDMFFPVVTRGAYDPDGIE
jgi:predicted outer membrane repeat protein